jgi:protein gp37
MAITKIEWATDVWNPVRGCTPVSIGCANCYAARMATRFAGEGGPYEGFAAKGRWTGNVRVIPEALDLPRRWRKPRRVFVNSMSDLLHESVTDSVIADVAEVIRDCPQHVFQVLTKRSGRLAQFDIDWPSNAWVGVSVEDTDVVKRIDDLRPISAVVKWVSFEPLIGPVAPNLDGIAWAVVGGESGPGCRPMEEHWVQAIFDECRRYGTAFFFKQWGGINKKAAGRLWKGQTWDEMPVNVPAYSR